MENTVKKCFDELQKRFQNIEFCIGAAMNNDQKNTVIIDRNILEDMATDPVVAKSYERKITLMLELQKIFAQNGEKDSVKSNKMVLLD